MSIRIYFAIFVRFARAVPKSPALAFALLLLATSACALTPQREFSAAQFDQADLARLEAEFGQRKKIPARYRAQILTALSFFPELREVKIDFVVRKSVIPLSSRPRLGSLLRAAKHRRYLITISSQSTKELTPILLENLPYNAQVGVLGHEISHVANYLHTSAWGLARIGWGLVFSDRATDRFEANTDQTCIEHGLGFQLHAWSVEIYKIMGDSVEASQGQRQPMRERYLRPETILRRMRELSLYQSSIDERA